MRCCDFNMNPISTADWLNKRSYDNRKTVAGFRSSKVNKQDALSKHSNRLKKDDLKIKATVRGSTAHARSFIYGCH